MADSRPAVQLLNQVFSANQLNQYAALQTYLEQGGSIFPLVEKGERGLMKDYGLSQADARRFLRRANSMAIYLRRQFIEHILHGSEKKQAWQRTGLLSMVQGPNFERLFDPEFERSCPPQALESLASPVAYLIELMRWIAQRIEPASSDVLKLPLHDRRKDLKPLVIDFNAVHRAVSSVDIIVPVLETFINEHEGPADIEQAMIDARYPNGLPYYQHWITLDTVAHRHGLSVGSFAQRVDLAFPYFLQAQAWDASADRALAHASRLGPYQRRLLTEPPIKLEDKDSFYRQNFGADGLSWQNLHQVPFFGERTKLDTPGLEALLSVRGFAPVRSTNVTYPVATPGDGPESGRSGSVYINANSHPGVSIISQEGGSSSFHWLSANPDNAAGLQCYDRMNRKVRLDQWLALPSEQVDTVLVAAMRAEVRGGAPAGSWWITDNVVHALGLFQSLRERYGCPVSDFAVFIDQLSVYGRAEVPSQFDQVFNDEGDYREPLKLDNGTFPLLPEPGAPDLTVTQLCSALGIDLQTYQYLALMIAAAHDITDESLPRNLAIFSSFYRLVKLPRLLGITPVEGVLMLTLLGGETWIKALAGVPRIDATRGEAPDVLNLIQAMQLCVQWCTDRDLPVLWMLQHISAPQVLAATDVEHQLFNQIFNLLPGALFTDAAVLMAGVPPLTGASWLTLLWSLVDIDGLVVTRSGTEAEYLAFAREELDKAVIDGLGDKYDEERPAFVEKMLTVLLQARDAQVAVAKESLAGYTGVSADQAIEVLAWANATVYRLLHLVLERDRSNLEDSVKERDEPLDPWLVLLADVRRLAAVVAKLELSAQLLRDYLAYGYKAWLGQDDSHEFTVRTLYYLTTLTRAFELSEQPAQTLLDYLREVNALPSPLTGDALRLAQQAASIRLAGFFDWSVQEVRECISRIDPALMILKNLTQLDLLMRVRVLAAQTGMDALTIFLVGTLPEDVDKPAYKDAAEHALLSLSESGVPSMAFTGDLKQLVTMTCTVDNTDVIAKPGEKITFTVTLKDRDGKALSGVMVYWSVELGTIVNKETDVDGTVQVDFYPGKVIGTDTPQYWLDLFEREYAPTIRVNVDASTLQFPPPLMSKVPLGPVPYGQEVELFATLMDRYQNIARQSLVRWLDRTSADRETSPLKFRPNQSYTDQEGVARTFVSSSAGGTFEIGVLTDAGDSISNFERFTFADEEPAS
ncbi:virulence plasmid 28 protein [Pseudomonas brassicacearum]|uniref:Tc toxin subunit A n=1 Tax=Pseudomonas brassicacearum TaxID=930166 RepID=UPI00042F39D1|nr:Tc toxin subunit A [Pseudomonas brassicacearum]AHL35695.1 virulence plasmid 28 protein [Pseudomonas brassicacearum]